ncbi:MAG TPA: hypothetical protein VGX03_04530 [Candidatus Binatia bacterium]|jgi:hypothetical protein|nr:hypothetical protein [Candidatus Binatia bacterium]
MIPEKKKLLNLLVIQGFVCFLIPLWGAAMIVAALIRRNPTWMVLGFVVIFVGLPFAGNALRTNGSSGERKVFP